MCGIVGVLNLADRLPTDKAVLCSMLGAIRHRGPDEFGLYRDPHVGLGSARLSILDLSTGQQPIGNEDGTLWIVYNGEVFNYLELRPGLEARGHRFTTSTDTEVVLHLYEELGVGCLHHLNGQFALAIWDARQRTLFLARDRLGIRPLFYTVSDGRLIFASEIKALLAHPGVNAEIDPLSLEQIFTFWSTLSPRTVFRGIDDIPPGHYLLAREGQVSTQPYWSLDFSAEPSSTPTPVATQQYLEEFETLLIDATRIRLRADVPVGAYLSGGLDSSVTAAIIRRYTSNSLDTFSITFEDPAFDEGPFQQQMAALLGTNHRVAQCRYADIGRVFPDVVWHAETPILRTSPAPMYILSRLVQDHHLKVVLTGEGADEILAGYNIFKEMKVRRFWARVPESRIRPLLLGRLYPYIPALRSGKQAYLSAFFGKGLNDTNSPCYSHALRWSNTARIRRFLSHEEEDLRVGQDWEKALPALPQAFRGWSPLAQAQYLEMSLFLSQYLLSSQGDRMLMAHSVEGRFPFLDYRVVEFCNRLPSGYKLRGLTEKWLLKQLGRRLVPAEIWQRPKQPYRAPIQRSFLDGKRPDYVGELLSEQSLQDVGLFKPAAVARLIRKAEEFGRLGEVEEMALVGMLSTQLLHHRFVHSFSVTELSVDEPMRIIDRTEKKDGPSLDLRRTASAHGGFLGGTA
jgi:asparagine synthase (glutamine-hydrolysing)